MPDLKIDPAALRDAVRDIHDPDIRFYGVYDGRGGFHGIGVTVEHDSQLMRLACALKDHGAEGLDALATGYDHGDSMGYGRVIAWRMRRFIEPTAEQIEEWEEESEYA